MRSAFYVARRIFVAMVAFATVGATSAAAQWTQIATLQSANVGSMNAYHNGYLYIFGGTGVPVGGSRLAILRESWKIDVTTGERTEIAPLPNARRFGYAAEANGKIYILGGYNITQDGVANLLSNILEYDPATNSYVTKAQLPRPVIQVAGVSVSTNIFVIGGLTIEGQSLANSSDVQMYDVLTNTVVEMNPGPFAGDFAAAESDGSDIILVGGLVDNSIRSHVFKGVINGSFITWTQIATYPQPIYGAIPGQINGKVYITGGSTVSGTLSDRTYSYDAVGNKWDRLYVMPIATAIVNSMPGTGDKCYLAGGDRNDKVYTLEIGAAKRTAELESDFLVVTARAGGYNYPGVTLSNIGMAPLNGTFTVAAEAQAWLLAHGPPNFTVEPVSTHRLVFTVNATALAPGSYSTYVTITTNDPDFMTATLKVFLYVIPVNLQPQPSEVLVIEEASGAWCAPCGQYGVPGLRTLKAKYGDRIIILSYHDRGDREPTADTMATQETEAINDLFGVSTFPNDLLGVSTFRKAAFNRVLFNSFGDDQLVGTKTWPSATGSGLALSATSVLLKIDAYEYNAATRTVTASLKIKTTEALMLNAGDSLKVTCVVTEDSIKSPQNGIAENPFYHMDVARDFWPNIYGREISIPAEATAESGRVLLPNHEFTAVPVSFVVDNVANPRNGHVTFLIHINTTSGLGPIITAEQIKLTDTITGDSGQASYDIQTPTSYILATEQLQLGLNAPNPVSGTTTFEFVSPRPGVVSVDVFSMSGELVMSLPARIVERGAGSFRIDASNLPNGIYSIRLTANGASVQRTITVVR